MTWKTDFRVLPSSFDSPEADTYCSQKINSSNIGEILIVSTSNFRVYQFRRKTIKLGDGGQIKFSEKQKNRIKFRKSAEK